MMRNGFNVLPLVIFLCMSIALISHEANAQNYLPVGPQVDVPVAVVSTGGWIECYRDTYDNQLNAETVLERCPGDLLMSSCRPTGSDTLTLLAQAPREDVTFDTGENLDVTHIATVWAAFSTYQLQVKLSQGRTLGDS